ncbi:RecQ family ATP-dependent DNA helicase [Robertmurraya korlensis]|uniref:RecQ family ATP-dependent DNA helicase n=1 Tax=Robertmurraya korlensis TaxID=519977 RepID=UPI0008246727|nr:ATP-dependent DNA helicase RecQ [Robertmurraya korlensis]
MTLENKLKTHFGYDHFKKGQREIIEALTLGKNVLAMLPTGTGKSLCYQLPAYLMDGVVVVVTPLLSLMQDQVEQMMARGEKRVVAINSFLERGERASVFGRLHTYKFIYISPEMLMSDFVVSHLNKLTISLFVVDEAHCISQWGYDFRPDYLKLGDIRESLGSPQTIALTATADQEVRSDIAQTLKLNEWDEFVSSVDRPNIKMVVDFVQDARDKLDKLLEWVFFLQGPGIIYFSSKKLAEEVAIMLRDSGLPRAMAYHGGLDQESRILIQQQFIKGQLDVICATSAFGMGINKENVRFVIHFHMPLQLESYLQEIGRAGRDGENSISILLYSPHDEQLPYQLAEGELPTQYQINWLFQHFGDRLLYEWEEMEESIKHIGGFSDTSWRLTKDFLRSLNNSMDLKVEEERFLQYIDNRKKHKRNKIVDMLNWIQSKECKRKGILSYFGEVKQNTVEDCCHVCGIAYDQYNKKSSEVVEVTPFQWRDYLQALLSKSGTSYEK